MSAVGSFLVYLGLAVAAALLIVALLIRPLCYLIECDARRRYLRAARKRAQGRKGYWPIWDEEYSPADELANWPRVNDGTYLQIPRRRS